MADRMQTPTSLPEGQTALPSPSSVPYGSAPFSGSDPVLQASPALQQYARRMGLEEAMRRALGSNRISQTRNQVTRQDPFFVRQMEDAAERVGRDFEGRGFYRSGQRIWDQARAVDAVAAQRLAAQSQGFEGVLGEHRNTAADTATGRSDFTERRLSIAEELSRRAAGL